MDRRIDGNAIIAQLRDQVMSATRSKTSLRIRAGGTKDFYGQALVGEPLDPRPYAGIVDYDPTELVITARCGTSLAALEAAMVERGQHLAFEPPHFGGAATVGGMLATGLSGPRRMAAGALRDFVLGVRVMDGNGDVLTFGGQVMKNVAGYDLARVMAGSLGTLGLILEASLKALPLPVAEVTLRLELPHDKAIELMNRWGGKPLPISATVFASGDLTVRLSGAAASVRAARGKIGGDLVATDTASAFWRGVREHTDPFFASAAPLWRLSLPSTTAPLALPGEQMIEWGGALRWLASNADARTIRAAAAKCGGHATLFRHGDKSVGVFHPLEATYARLQRNLKLQFDPSYIFNPGRFYGDL